MKQHKITNLIVMFFAAALCCTSCDLTPDVAPIPMYDGKANTTIAELLAMHEISSADSYIHLPEDTADIIISGIVTTSDKAGNCYKYLNIEDETGAIQIKINNTALYNKYKVGQRVFVKCNGLDLGDYRKLPQLGMWANDKMEPIPNNLVSQYIFLHGMPVDFVPTITMTSIPNANEIPSNYYNRLVRIEGATFVEGGQATYSSASSATSHDINVAGGGTITLRTSNYANFIDETLPEGTGTIIGILTRYNNYVQLVIRDLDDVQGFIPPAHETNIFTVNYGNAFNDGWLRSGSGAEWQAMVNNNFHGFTISASQATDSWLISPAIDLTVATGAKLAFTHRAPQGGDNNTMKLYYTAHYNDASTEWTEVPVSNISTSSNQMSFSIPENAYSSDFRFAYRFNGNSGSWYISNIAISATVVPTVDK